jgi:hypothetical protein
MQVQVHTDNHIEGHERLSRWVESVVTDALARFAGRISSVQVHPATRTATRAATTTSAA